VGWDEPDYRSHAAVLTLTPWGGNIDILRKTIWSNSHWFQEFGKKDLTRVDCVIVCLCHFFTRYLLKAVSDEPVG
jgi:hypothetical protein